MEIPKHPLGFKIKQINNVYEKDLTKSLKNIGITASQCAVLDYLFHTNKEEVNQIVQVLNRINTSEDLHDQLKKLSGSKHQAESHAQFSFSHD